MKIDVHIHFDQREAPRWATTLREMVSQVLTNQETNMIDTKKILEAATRSTTDNASLRALIVSTKASLEKSIADLAVAIANSDPVAMAAAQKDLDDATALLDTDNAETKAALAANVPTPTP